MLLAKKSSFILLFYSYLTFTDGAFVDTLYKCKPEDSDCLKKDIKHVLESVAATGIPEYDIPPTDPMHLNNLKLNVFDVVNLIITDGELVGLKNCEAVDIKLKMDKGSVKIKMLCDLTAEGKYEVSGSTPASSGLFEAGSVSGKGNFKATVEKMLITYASSFDVVKRNGNIFLDCKKDNLKYEFDLQGDSQLMLDNLFIGKTDASKIVIDYYNQNSKMLWKQFSKKALAPFVDMAYDIIHKFFQTVETKNFLSGDLEKYVKN